ncbi:anhydro-N-acetylmuramic acid kinase [Oricola sp.]|uniref:anhydro-N-acetylmuramic acid kinase n=1 Tax=Oricola sp. TaxID=1979950 RepID=UPI0025F3AD9B|nr:anhydro-N-acetylmuramic acid kinase [Oricola sp.]MCI5073925.1 anhydro-N-acetylmuramic acid kinase [Oricola sp.]
MRLMRAIGLMSGTSMDGIDVAMIETDGIRVAAAGPSMSVSYDPSFRRDLEAGLEDAKAIRNRDERPGGLRALEEALTGRHAEAVRRFLDASGLGAGDVDVIGFHGQTVLHRPQDALTVQLGDGAALARATGICTVHDMRARDMEHGGQGAPLVPAYHAALATALPAALEPGFGSVAFVNVGGISNVTFVAPGSPPIAFDCGPGNALIDQWVQAHAGIPYDAGGRIASEGSANTVVVGRYMAHPFFERQGPKSLDRGDFTLDGVAGLELSDGAATLAAVSAAAIARASEYLPARPTLWIVSGGGAHNRAIMDRLDALTGPQAKVVTAAEAGLRSDMMEAEAWAYLAVRSLCGLPLTFPTTTGCDRPVSGGILTMPG